VSIEESTFAAPSPDPELERLEPLLGTWRTEGSTEDSVLGPGVPVTSTETFFSNNGPFTEEAIVMLGEVVGGDLILEGPARFR
jgi:hypothetical protein